MANREAVAGDDGESLVRTVLGRVGSAPLGVYVHIPWCRSRCGYCDFNAYVARRPVATTARETMRAAAREIRLLRSAMPGQIPDVGSVFFGGGTPTLLPVDDLAAMLGCVAGEIGLAPDAEITIEANPETLSPDVLRGLRSGGFNRLSIGVQSTVPSVLAGLGRVQDAQHAIEAVSRAREVGFENVNVDLIYGTPGEVMADWVDSLRACVGAEVDHISTYALKIEERTRMGAARARGELADPDPDTLADRYEMADALIGDSGLAWYEISNWSRPDRECRHNLGYWRSYDWVGVGAGAHSHVAGTRWWNVKRPHEAWRLLRSGRLPVESGEVLDSRMRDREEVMLRLRLREGVCLPARARARAVALAESGLLEGDPASRGTAVLTLRGRLLGDLVTRELLDASNAEWTKPTPPRVSAMADPVR